MKIFVKSLALIFIIALGALITCGGNIMIASSAFGNFLETKVFGEASFALMLIFWGMEIIFIAYWSFHKLFPNK